MMDGGGQAVLQIRQQRWPGERGPGGGRAGRPAHLRGRAGEWGSVAGGRGVSMRRRPPVRGRTKGHPGGWAHRDQLEGTQSPAVRFSMPQAFKLVPLDRTAGPGLPPQGAPAARLPPGDPATLSKWGERNMVGGMGAAWR
jgi:hypothetical protein